MSKVWIILLVALLLTGCGTSLSRDDPDATKQQSQDSIGTATASEPQSLADADADSVKTDDADVKKEPEISERFPTISTADASQWLLGARPDARISPSFFLDIRDSAVKKNKYPEERWLRSRSAFGKYLVSLPLDKVCTDNYADIYEINPDLHKRMIICYGSLADREKAGDVLVELDYRDIAVMGGEGRLFEGDVSLLQEYVTEMDQLEPALLMENVSYYDGRDLKNWMSSNELYRSCYEYCFIDIRTPDEKQVVYPEEEEIQNALGSMLQWVPLEDLTPESIVCDNGKKPIIVICYSTDQRREDACLMLSESTKHFPVIYFVENNEDDHKHDEGRLFWSGE